MSSSDLDTQTLAEYRRVIEQAAATSPDARAAVSHVFAALDRRDKRTREMLEIVRAVADTQMQYVSGTAITASVLLCPWCRNVVMSRDPTQVEHHAPDCPVTRARTLLGGGK